MQALEVPELLRLVGEFLDYPRLAAATAVCKTWNTIFTPFLYHTIERRSYFRGPSSVVLKDHVDHVRAIKLYSTFWIPPLAGCTYLKELHLDLIFYTDDTKRSWIPFADLVHQNPRLDTVCVTNPSNDFLMAVFASCPQLKRLEIDWADLSDVVMADLFNVCLRLEELKMANTSMDVGEHHDDSWINWPTFPTIKKLWIGISIVEHWYRRQAQQQYEFIRRCPNLESLTWSFARGPFLIDKIQNLLSPKTSPCPRIKAFEFRYPGVHPTLSEHIWHDILRGDNKCLTSFGCYRFEFGELSSRRLISSLGSTLTRLRADDSRVSSVAMMSILSSCPHLIHVSSAGSLDAREILGLKRDTSEVEDYLAVVMYERKSTGGSLQREPLPKPIYPLEWACRNLQTLEIGICGLENKASEWQRAILKQLAKLTQLRVLNVQTEYAVSLGEGSVDGLDFRLTAGLDILSSLTMLEALRFGDLWQEMSEHDIEWMVKTWPRFSYIQGWVHHSQSRRVELKRLLKRHGVVVEFCQGFDPPAQDEEDERI